MDRTGLTWDQWVQSLKSLADSARLDATDLDGVREELRRALGEGASERRPAR